MTGPAELNEEVRAAESPSRPRRASDPQSMKTQGLRKNRFQITDSRFRMDVDPNASETWDYGILNSESGILVRLHEPWVTVVQQRKGVAA
jgi:hypothetical protein